MCDLPTDRRKDGRTPSYRNAGTHLKMASSSRPFPIWNLIDLENINIEKKSMVSKLNFSHQSSSRQIHVWIPAFSFEGIERAIFRRAHKGHIPISKPSPLEKRQRRLSFSNKEKWNKSNRTTMRPLGIYLIGISIFNLNMIHFLMISGDFGGFFFRC